MDGLDPYAQLGVPRDADERAIRIAYRRRTKTDHPDAGGDPDEWAATCTALAVLVDPKKRKTFDETGRIEEDRPDNDRATALQMVELQIGQIVNAYIASGFAPASDPRLMDVPNTITQSLLAEIAEAHAGIQGGERVVAYLKDMAQRFHLRNPDAHPEGDPIARGFKRQIDNAEQQLANIRASITHREIAIAIVADYRFEQTIVFNPDAYHRGERGPYSWSVRDEEQWLAGRRSP